MVAMLPFGTDPVPPYIALPIAAILLIGISLLGYRVIPSRLRPLQAFLTLPLAASVGMTTVGVVVWTVGAVIGTTTAILLAVAMMAAGLTAAKMWWRDVRVLARRVSALLRHNLLLAGLGLATVALAVPQLLLPVVDSDGLRYHLALAKLYLLEGRVVFYPWDVHAAFPQAVEAVQMLGLRAAGGEVAKFLHFGAFLGSLVVLILLLHRGRGSRRTAAVCAPWFFAASPAVLAASGAAFIDLFVVFHVGVAALLARFRSNPLLIGIALGRGPGNQVVGGAGGGRAGPAGVGARPIQAERPRGLCPPGADGAGAVHGAQPGGHGRSGLSDGRRSGPGSRFPGLNEERHEYVTQVHREIPGPFGIPWGALGGRGPARRGRGLAPAAGGDRPAAGDPQDAGAGAARGGSSLPRLWALRSTRRFGWPCPCSGALAALVGRSGGPRLRTTDPDLWAWF